MSLKRLLIPIQDEPQKGEKIVKIVHAEEMKTDMNEASLTSLKQVQKFLEGSVGVSFKISGQQACYNWISKELARFKYQKLKKGEKSIIKAYLERMTGYSRAQLTRLINQHGNSYSIKVKRIKRNTFSARYNRADIVLLAQTDEFHQTLSGPATKKLFERGHKIFKEAQYERLSNISVAHIYNLRKSGTYQSKRRIFTKTQRTKVTLGERRKPAPNGLPGYLRIDTVHQGDEDGVKGVYYINAVDEVTQMEVICAVEKISENYLIPVLAELIEHFPFEIQEIHADNGSEYINKHVVKLLKKLFIDLTKSRSRHSNDNALAECKNGAVVRKWLGHAHIPQRYAGIINEFLKNYFVPYINYHRPCYYAEIITDEKTGKQHKKYPYKNMMTPYEKLKSLSEAKAYLSKGVSFKALDKLARQETDLESAKNVQKAREELFKEISKDLQFEMIVTN